MSQITIYGASDDLIEVEGAITEEFNPPEDEPSYLAFSDGSLLSITYTDDGLWKISVFCVGEDTAFEMESATDVDDNYSDRVTLTGEFKWVVCGPGYAKERK